MASNRMAGLGLLLAFSGVAQAQELRCNQVFMNASEKRICATPALMDLDKQIGEVGRRAALHQNGFKSDQRKFRKALKACDGDEACLTVFYQSRIAELQAFVETLPPPAEDELAKLAKAGEKAEAKRDAQAGTRERIAEKLAQQEAKAQEDIPVAEEATAVEPAPVDSLPTERVVETPAAQEVTPATAMDQAATLETPKEPYKIGVGGISILVLIAIGILAWLKSVLNQLVDRCPQCTRWFAGEVIDREQDSYTDYETKTFEDVHRDRNYRVTGRTSRPRQVRVRVVKTTRYYQCKHCNHQWVLTSTSRSS